MGTERGELVEAVAMDEQVRQGSNSVISDNHVEGQHAIDKTLNVFCTMGGEKQECIRGGVRENMKKRSENAPRSWKDLKTGRGMSRASTKGASCSKMTTLTTPATLVGGKVGKSTPCSAGASS